MFDAPIIARANNVSEAVFDYSIAIVSAGGLIGRTIAGVLADKFGVWNVFGTTSFLTVVCLFGFFVPTPIPSGAVAAGFAVYGALSGAWLTLVTAVVATISPVEEVGMRIGMAWSVCGPFMIAGPVICGGEYEEWRVGVTWGCGCRFRLQDAPCRGKKCRAPVPGAKPRDHEHEDKHISHTQPQ
jgi:MFS family permease